MGHTSWDHFEVGDIPEGARPPGVGGRPREVGARRPSGLNPYFAPAVLAWMTATAVADDISVNALISRTMDAAYLASGAAPPLNAAYPAAGPVVCPGTGEQWSERLRCPHCTASAKTLGVPAAKRTTGHRVPAHTNRLGTGITSGGECG